MPSQAPKMCIFQTPKTQVSRRTKLDCLRPEWQKKDQVTVRPPLSATSPRWPLFWQTVHALTLKPLDNSYSLQCPLSSVSEVAVIIIIADVSPLNHYLPFQREHNFWYFLLWREMGVRIICLVILTPNTDFVFSLPPYNTALRTVPFSGGSIAMEG